MERTISAYGNLNNFVQGSCMILRRELMKMVLPVPIFASAHDNWIVQFALLLESRCIVRDQLMSYRIHGENTSSFHVNKPKRLSTIKLLLWKTRNKSGTNDLLDIQLKQIREIQSRAGNLDRNDPIFQFIKKREILFNTESLIMSLKRRVIIRESPFLTRLIKATSMLLTRDYHNYHNNINSYSRDLFLL